MNKTFSFHDQYMEWGFFTINKLIARLGGNYALMFFVVAIISWFFIFKSVTKPYLTISNLFYFH